MQNSNAYPLTVLTFSTAGGDYPDWEDNAASAGATNAAIIATRFDNDVTVSFYATSITPPPAGYYIYYIDTVSGNQYSPAMSWSFWGTMEGRGLLRKTFSNALATGHPYCSAS